VEVYICPHKRYLTLLIVLVADIASPADAVKKMDLIDSYKYKFDAIGEDGKIIAYLDD
jgi:hypothetical protein